MATGMQRRLARAVCAPAGVEHLEDSAVLDQLASASGELSTSGPADAPMALASAFGDRLGGFLACVVLATFRWYIGVLFFARLDAAAAAAAAAAGRAGHAGAPGDARAAAQLVLPGLLLPAGVRQGGHGCSASAPGSWAGTGPSGWRAWSRRGGRCAVSGTGRCCSAPGSPRCTSSGAGALALAAYHHDIALGTVAVMLPMLPSTMQVGGVSVADVSLEQMLAAVPDLDELIARLRATPSDGRRPAERSRACLPATIRFESVGYRYPTGGQPVYEGLDLELAGGHVAGPGRGPTARARPRW